MYTHSHRAHTCTHQHSQDVGAQFIDFYWEWNHFSTLHCSLLSVLSGLFVFIVTQVTSLFKQNGKEKMTRLGMTENTEKYAKQRCSFTETNSDEWWINVQVERLQTIWNTAGLVLHKNSQSARWIGHAQKKNMRNLNKVKAYDTNFNWAH